MQKNASALFASKQLPQQVQRARLRVKCLPGMEWGTTGKVRARKGLRGHSPVQFSYAGKTAEAKAFAESAKTVKRCRKFVNSMEKQRMRPHVVDTSHFRQEKACPQSVAKVSLLPWRFALCGGRSRKAFKGALAGNVMRAKQGDKPDLRRKRARRLHFK